jgi:EAL domain-containing protein (putative c-di-GMP-specific phosphodiesterase class I)
MEDIADILSEERLVVHLQPILSLRGRTFFGYEALVRGVSCEGSMISPGWLFSEALKENLSSQLDRKSRLLAIHSFFPLWKANPKLLLFVNFESKLIDSFKPGDYLFDGLLNTLGIPCSNIVLEIKEDEVSDVAKLDAFCTYYRSLGFYIALDDFGVGQSSFDRLGIVRPDIIKIDRSLITGIENNYIHQGVVQAICKMSSNIGALTLAEGVETLEEAVYSKHLGTTLVQGFWFAKPSIELIDTDFDFKIEMIKARCQKMMMNFQHGYDALCAKAEASCQKIHKAILEAPDLSQWHIHVESALENESEIEALYLIDANGKQIGATLMQCTTRSFYEPTAQGSDHRFAEYYVRARESASGYHLTNNYLSLASGNVCLTYSCTRLIKDEVYVLCIDFTK